MYDQPTVLITGANRGLGLALTKQYLNKHWNVLACCRNPEFAGPLNQLCSKDMTDTQVLRLDLEAENDIDEISHALKLKPIDILINVAGIYGPRESYFGDLNYAEWQKVLTVNTIAPLVLTQALIQNILATNKRTIANISSVVGRISFSVTRGKYMYPSSKIALNGLTRILASDLANKHVTVVGINPGHIKTKMCGNQGDIEVTDSAAGIFEILNTISFADTGKLLNYDGQNMSW